MTPPIPGLPPATGAALAALLDSQTAFTAATTQAGNDAMEAATAVAAAKVSAAAQVSGR